MSFVNVRNTLGRGGLIGIATVYTAVLAAGGLVLFQPQKASAATLTSRKLGLSSSANGNVSTDANGVAVTAGTGGNGAKVKYTFTFTPPVTGTVGSIEFQFCNSPLAGTTCTVPTGLDASTVTTVGGTSGTSGSWAMGTGGNVPTASRVRITHTPASMTNTAQQFIIGAGGTGTDYIKNPTTDNTTIFVRIATFSDAAWVTPVDTGSVASSTAQQIDITAKVQETLGFSVGTNSAQGGAGNVNTPSTNCAALTDPQTGAVALGDTNGVLSSTAQYTANSYYRISTNANSGATVQYSGDTLKSGANSINAINSAANPLTSPGTAAAGTIGSEQFGLTIGSDDTTTNGYSLTDQTRATPAISPTAYSFNVASMTAPITLTSSTGIITCDTASVKYLGNISTTSVPGIYKTTITYIATPTY